MSAFSIPLFVVLFLAFVSSAAVFLVRNPVHAVFCLVSAFVMTAGLFVMMGAEFLGFVIMVVYIGAVAIFFLFVVMMLDTGTVGSSGAGSSRGFCAAPQPSRSASLLTFFCLFLGELVLVSVCSYGGSRFIRSGAEQGGRLVSDGSDFTQSIGHFLYTTCGYPLQGAAVVLFVAMVGAIALVVGDDPKLSVRTDRGSRLSQGRDVWSRVQREDVLTVVDLKPGQGVLTFYEGGDKRD